MQPECMEAFDIVYLLKNEEVITYFQPIISVNKRAVMGLEALSRGAFNASVVPPKQLFDVAEKANLTLELDRLCRKKALEAFVPLSFQNNELLLFLNIDTSIFDQGVSGSGNLFNMVHSLKLDPNRIVIEVNEAKAHHLDALKSFIDTYREYGFLIALDDVGAGHSDLNRLTIVKPDIIKVDMGLIKGIDTEFYKQEVFKSLVSLSRKVGAMVIAEGVETESEAIAILDLGCDVLQGYYFSKPQKLDSLSNEMVQHKQKYIADRFKEYAYHKAKNEKCRSQEFEHILSGIIYELSGVPSSEFDAELSKMIRSYPKVECIYILDESGIQVSDTVCNSNRFSMQKRMIYKPALRGTDHSLKRYYYHIISTEVDRYITDPYISMASGSLCITISKVFRDTHNRCFILCVDAAFI